MKRLILGIVATVAACTILAGCTTGDGMQIIERDAYTLRVPSSWSTGAETNPGQYTLHADGLSVKVTETTVGAAPANDDERVDIISSEGNEDLEGTTYTSTEVTNIGAYETCGYPDVTESVVHTTENLTDEGWYDHSWEYETRFSCWVDDDTWVRFSVYSGDEAAGPEVIDLLNRISEGIESR